MRHPELTGGYSGADRLGRGAGDRGRGGATVAASLPAIRKEDVKMSHCMKNPTAKDVSRLMKLAEAAVKKSYGEGADRGIVMGMFDFLYQRSVSNCNCPQCEAHRILEKLE